jgi:hypothetical protein
MLVSCRDLAWYVAIVYPSPHHNLAIQYTTDMDSSRLQSVTQEKDLDEFLNTARLAGTEFTAGSLPYVPYLLLAHHIARASKREDYPSLYEFTSESLPTFRRGRNIHPKETERE